MSNQKLLPVRLRPEPGEHFSAYMLRLAIANGRSSVKELFSTLKISGSRAHNHLSPDTQAALAGWLGLSHAELRAFVISDRMLAKVTVNDSARIYRNLELRVPRLCTACLRAGNRIPSYFGQLPFTHCLVHSHELIHKCPDCQATLSWSEELFKCTCPNCHANLDEASNTTELPTYTSKLIACLSDPHGLNHFIRDLLLALQCVLEPLSSDLSTRERPPTETANWAVLLDQAYALLNDPAAMESWAEGCREHRSATAAIGASAVYLPIYTLKEKLMLPWPLRVFDCHAGQQPLNDPVAENTPSLAPVDHHLLSKILGCGSTEILPLVESSALEGIHGHRSVRDSRFDLCTLARQVEQLDTNIPGKPISMDRAARIASAHGGHMGHVLSGILLNEIPFKPKQDRENLLDGGHVCLDRLLAYMTKHFASLETSQCPLKETIAITGLNAKEIAEACTLGLIKPLGWRRDLCFMGGDISRLLSSHISIKRWSKISGVPARQLLANLPASRFDASIEGVLYKRTEKLDSWLNSFTRAARLGVPRH